MLKRILFAVLLLGTSGCATVLTSKRSPLSVRSDTVKATVQDVNGIQYGTTPLDTILPAGARQLVLSAQGYQPLEVSVGRRLKRITYLNLINPLGWLLDLATGAAWEHSPRRVERQLVALPSISEQPPAKDSLSSEVEAEILRLFSDAVEESGCEPYVTYAWRDASSQFRSAVLGTPVPDSTLLIIRQEIESVRQEVQELCSRTNPLIRELGEIRGRLEGQLPPEELDSTFLLFEPVYFDFGSWEIGDHSVRKKLREIGAQLAQDSLPVVLIVQGFADPIGSHIKNRELGFARAMAVIREIRSAGLPADCCLALSFGEEQERLIVPTAGADSEGAKLNRRVTFSIDYRETGTP